jgi:prepilin-type N-terminal cleavage/methylation domain-containing protein
MSTRMRDQSGFSLVELLTVISLMVIVMSATLTAFASFEQTTGTNQKQNEAQDAVRVGLAGVSRELRNLASPTEELPQAILRAGTKDLIFQSVGSNITRRVRYCLNTTTRRLWRQLDPAPFGALPDSTCPGTTTGWGTNTVAAANVVNGTRAVFGYNVANPLTDSDFGRITEISSTLWVDVNPGVRPLETSLQTSIFLRNQNRSPSAAFTADVNGSSIVFNGAQSFDPEGRSLRFYWYDTALATNSASCGVLPAVVPQTGCVGVNVVATYTPSAAGEHHVYLVVADPAGLIDDADSDTVCIPTLAQPCT